MAEPLLDDRERRPSESDDAYVFTDTASFEQRIHEGGFLEWTEFLGHYYGSPTPDAAPGRDVVLEIEVDGAQQVKKLFPEAMLLFVLPPSRDEQERRLRGRGDPNDKVLARLKKAEVEEPIGRDLADHVVVNDDLQTTTRRDAGPHRCGPCQVGWSVGALWRLTTTR